VVGIDNSLSMIGAAKAKGLDARLMDAADLKFSEAFDAAFSNATLHWVLDKERAARAIWFALKPGGRFVGEMGGDGNLAALRRRSTTSWSSAASARRPMPPIGTRRPRSSPRSTKRRLPRRRRRADRAPDPARPWRRGLGAAFRGLARPRRGARGPSAPPSPPPSPPPRQRHRRLRPPRFTMRKP
jgi:SAM-dependent methyltransferase